MSVRAKFKVDEFRLSLQKQKISAAGEWDAANLRDVEMRTVILAPVYPHSDPNHENTKFWNASPMGRIELGTINPDAWKAFELGKEYYVDFTPAEG